MVSIWIIFYHLKNKLENLGALLKLKMKLNMDFIPKLGMVEQTLNWIKI